MNQLEAYARDPWSGTTFRCERSPSLERGVVLSSILDEAPARAHSNAPSLQSSLPSPQKGPHTRLTPRAQNLATLMRPALPERHRGRRGAREQRGRPSHPTGLPRASSSGHRAPDRPLSPSAPPLTAGVPGPRERPRFGPRRLSSLSTRLRFDFRVTRPSEAPRPPTPRPSRCRGSALVRRLASVSSKKCRKRLDARRGRQQMLPRRAPR